MNQPIQQGSIEMTDTRENESQVGRQDEEAPLKEQWKKPQIRKLGDEMAEGKATNTLGEYGATRAGPS
jgi:hypothetical protein